LIDENMPNRALTDLAGNAFNGFAVMAVLVSMLATVRLPSSCAGLDHVHTEHVTDAPDSGALFAHFSPSPADDLISP
jgi:hypothetical protein